MYDNNSADVRRVGDARSSAQARSHVAHVSNIIGNVPLVILGADVTLRRGFIDIVVNARHD
jgi:hypothetical protein